MSLITEASISQHGAICLSSELTCDGFSPRIPFRVQTHVHDDHMAGFTESKGYQTLIMTEATKRLLVFEFNADLAYRENLREVQLGARIQLGESSVILRDSGHMLGSVQVEHHRSDGIRVGYSGDFAWPLLDPINVDLLVVDSTYGSPRRRRHYSQGDAEQALIDLVKQLKSRGPIHLKAHRGSLCRALQVLSAEFTLPIVGSRKRCEEAKIYCEFGYPIHPLLDKNEETGRSALKGECIHIYSKGDEMPVNYTGSSIVLTAFTAKPDNPVTKYSDRSWAVAISNHADYDGTIEYVLSTGAKSVIVDNTRGAHGEDLALHLRTELGLEAIASSVDFRSPWEN